MWSGKGPENSNRRFPIGPLGVDLYVPAIMQISKRRQFLETLLPKTALTHWQTQRDLRVDLVQELPVDDPPVLSGKDIEGLRRLRPELETGTGFFSIPDKEDNAEPADSRDG